MSTTYSTNVGLGCPADSDRSWGIPIRATITQLDALDAIGPLGVRPAEIPSTTLNVSVAAGSFRKSDGTLVSYAGIATQALTASATNYMYLSDAGTLVTNTTGWPATTFHVRLATVVVGASTITSVTPARVPWLAAGKNLNTVYLALVGGTLDDSGGVVTVGLGSTNGSKVGATGDKVGFLGAAPALQQANSVDIAALLATFGLRASGGNPPLNLGTGALACGAFNPGGLITIADAQNVVTGSTTGSKLPQAATQKLGLWGVTPIVQPASANQAAVGTLATTALTNSTGGTADGTLAAVGVTGATNPSDVSGDINNNFTELAVKLVNTVTDLGALRTLVNQIRSDLVAAGALKGSA